MHLPPAAPISAISAARWLAGHWRGFAGPLERQLRRHPAGTLRAAAIAFGHAVRARKGTWALPRKSPLKEFLQAMALADAIGAAGDVRHIHAHFCHSATTVAWLASMVTGLPLSFTAHAKDVYCADLNPAGLLARKLNAARFVVTCTDANRVYLQSLTATPVHCIYHGLDVEFARLCGVEARPRQPESRVRVLAVGRLVAKKGIDVLIEACAILRGRGVPIEATIAAKSGDQEPALRALVSALGLDDAVVFTGPLTQRRLFDEYTRASVFCLPCRVLENGDRDGIPNVMAEAMACGLPVVTTAVSGIPELLADGVNGLLVAPDDPVRWRTRWRRCIAILRWRSGCRRSRHRDPRALRRRRARRSLCRRCSRQVRHEPRPSPGGAAGGGFWPDCGLTAASSCWRTVPHAGSGGGVLAPWPLKCCRSRLVRGARAAVVAMPARSRRDRRGRRDAHWRDIRRGHVVAALAGAPRRTPARRRGTAHVWYPRSCARAPADIPVGLVPPIGAESSCSGSWTTRIFRPRAHKDAATGVSAFADAGGDVGGAGLDQRWVAVAGVVWLRRRRRAASRRTPSVAGIAREAHPRRGGHGLAQEIVRGMAVVQASGTSSRRATPGSRPCRGRSPAPGR